ncbi:hypothetical protein [Flagellimonas lutaonensis]|uniref:DUF4136 domain-containing protein n=1 Tax=Flagellimonas lutaonensis TaxID=516051 RepID=A0A0D5YQX5_9FLAO|nr:hypothetical protein [Allomuricauda lutaonensis]AKA34246.1 hypothetical protein VC82_573 [Allomuricauda lutaonensis]
MKKMAAILAILMMASCSSTRFVDSWRNKEVTNFDPNKVLIVGMTDNLTARKIFEEKLKESFIARGINAHESSMVLDEAFTDSKKSEAEVEAMKNELIADGFDAVVITAVIGIDEDRLYQSGHYTFGNYWWYRFGRYYYRFQDVYYTPGYYKDYKVFHIETSIYNIKEDEGKTLVWVGTFKIVDPSNITTTVNDYVERIVQQLESEGIILTLPQTY